MKRFIFASALLLAAGPVGATHQHVASKKLEKLALDPFDPAWEQAPSARIAVAPQKLVVPTGGGGVPYVEVQSLRTPAEIQFRLRWPDPVKDEDLELSGEFVDGVALEFPLKEGTMPAPLMGEKGAPVNIWRWSAAMFKPDHYPKAYSDYYRPDAIDKTIKYPGKPEDLVAEGWGTVGRRGSQAVEGRSEWKDGVWTVVFSRKLSAPGGAAFKSGSIMPIAVAVWDGGAKERGPAKSFSVWNNLLLDRDPPSPSKNPVERGRLVYRRYGCGACHGAGGVGGVPNPGAQVDPIPGLQRVAAGFTEDELKAVILNGRQAIAADPAGPAPRLHMNAWRTLMDDAEAHAVIDYLMSLMPKGDGTEF